MTDRKKVLLIALLFFDYYKEMVNELEKMNYEVVYVCDAPSNSNISKALGRLNKKLIEHATKNISDTYVSQVVNDKMFDYVVVVAGMTFSFTPKMVEYIKNKQLKSIFVMYQWDSEKNLPFSTGIHKYFDRIYTFDRIDAQNKSFYSFLPLFYIKEYESINPVKDCNIKYDCMYIGTAHPLKYKYIKELSGKLNEIMPNQFIYHYMPSLLKYIYQKFTSKDFKDAKFSEFEREKVNKNKLLEIFQQSNCILDVPQKGQTGLTIRTIECLGAKRKLITTNTDIVNYDFYNPHNIYIYTGNINIKDVFFSSNFEDIPIDIYNKYSLKCWLNALLNG